MNNIYQFPELQGPPANTAPSALKGGGGGGTYDDMEPRVKALEKAFERIDAKLDKLGADATSLRVDIAEIKGRVTALPDVRSFGELQGRIAGMPTGEQFGRLSERLEKLPTFKKIAALVAFVGVLLGVLISGQKLYDQVQKPSPRSGPSEALSVTPPKS